MLATYNTLPELRQNFLCTDRPVKPPEYAQLRMMKVVVIRSNGQHTVLTNYYIP